MRNSLPFLQSRFMNPEGFKDAFVNYLKTNGCSVDVSKSIAQVAYYDQRAIGATTRGEFFQGTFVQANTNLQNSYTTPKGEHTVITRIRILDGNNATLGATDWNYGAGLPGTKNGQFTVVINGTRYLVNYPSGAACDDLTTDDLGFIDLAEPLIWQGQTRLQIDFTQPAAGAANDNLRFELHGVGLVS